MNNKDKLVIVLPILEIVFAIVSYFFLPSTVVAQIDIEGNPALMLPKLMAVLILIGLAVLAIIMKKLQDDGFNSRRCIVITVVAIILNIMLLVVNR